MAVAKTVDAAAAPAIDASTLEENADTFALMRFEHDKLVSCLATEVHRWRPKDSAIGLTGPQLALIVEQDADAAIHGGDALLRDAGDKGGNIAKVMFKLAFSPLVDVSEKTQSAFAHVAWPPVDEPWVSELNSGALVRADSCVISGRKPSAACLWTSEAEGDGKKIFVGIAWHLFERDDAALRTCTALHGKWMAERG